MTREEWRRLGIGVLGVCLVSAVILATMGRSWWCSCASPVPWSFDTWSQHNSQHVFDAYSFSHMLHGVVFYGLLFPLARWLTVRWRAIAAAGIEGAWEILENTPMVIDKYRENTVSLDYYGDSIANSIADIGFCVAGFGLAAAVPVWTSVVGFAMTEMLLLWWIKDSLVLNVIMLVYPLQIIKDWQSS